MSTDLEGPQHTVWTFGPLGHKDIRTTMLYYAQTADMCSDVRNFFIAKSSVQRDCT